MSTDLKLSKAQISKIIQSKTKIRGSGTTALIISNEETKEHKK